MSIHDDDDPSGSATVQGSNFWYPFQSGSALLSIGPVFNKHDCAFLHCSECWGVLDPWDVVHDDYGDLRCAYCASAKLWVIP